MPAAALIPFFAWGLRLRRACGRGRRPAAARVSCPASAGTRLFAGVRALGVALMAFYRGAFGADGILGRTN
jgi:hypothetical protein